MNHVPSLYRTTFAFNCGYKSLMALAQLEALPVPSDALVRLTAAYGRRHEVSALDIENAAAMMGMELDVLQIEFEELKGMGCPAIVHLRLREGLHFALFVDVDGENVRLMNDAASFSTMLENDFKEAYTGAAILLGFPRTPILEWARTSAVLGTMTDERREVTATFTCRNVSDEPARLAIGRTSDLVAALSADTLDPGEGATLTITARRRGARGPVCEWAEVLSSDPEVPVVLLSVHYENPPRHDFGPSKLDFVARKGSTTSTQVLVIPAHGSSVVGVNIGDHDLSATMLGPPTASWIVKRAELISVTLATDAALGTHQTELLIQTDFASDPTISIPITAQVVPTVTCWPPRLYFEKRGAGVLFVDTEDAPQAGGQGLSVEVEGRTPIGVKLTITANGPGEHELEIRAGGFVFGIPVHVGGG